MQIGYPKNISSINSKIHWFTTILKPLTDKFSLGEGIINNWIAVEFKIGSIIVQGWNDEVDVNKWETQGEGT